MTPTDGQPQLLVLASFVERGSYSCLWLQLSPTGKKNHNKDTSWSGLWLKAACFPILPADCWQSGLCHATWSSTFSLWQWVSLSSVGIVVGRVRLATRSNLSNLGPSGRPCGRGQGQEPMSSLVRAKSRDLEDENCSELSVIKSETKSSTGLSLPRKPLTRQRQVSPVDFFYGDPAPLECAEVKSASGDFGLQELLELPRLCLFFFAKKPLIQSEVFFMDAHTNLQPSITTCLFVRLSSVMALFTHVTSKLMCG